MKKTAIVDLSAVYWRYYHANESAPQDATKRQTLTFVRDLYNDFDNILVATDCPPYKRKEIYPEYKAQRPERGKAQIEQLKQTQEEILKDGWSVLTCQGAEADDIIGTYCTKKADDEHVTIFGTDKDLLQVVGGDVVLFDKFNKKEKTAENTLGVEPNQVVDYLAMVGDASDNIKGIPKVGDKTAKALLDEFGNIANMIYAIEGKHLYSVMNQKNLRFGDENGEMKTSLKSSLIENKDQLYLSRELVTLDTECEIITTIREVKRNMNDNIKEEEQTNFTEVEETQEAETQTALAVAPSHVVSHEIVSYRQGLDPNGTTELVQASQRLYDSGLYPKFRTPQMIMAIIMRGREIGIGATTALDSMSMIQGKPTMSAQLLQGLVMGSGKCQYFDLVESTDKIATFATMRKGSKREIVHSFTVEDAQNMKLLGKDNYEKQLPTMLRWRCSSALCKIGYPDVVLGVYSTEEMES